MVAHNLAYKHYEEEQEIDYTYLPDPLKYTSVSLQEVIDNKMRLEASAFNLEAKTAKDKILANRYGYDRMFPNDLFVTNAFHAPRFKRNYVEKIVPNSIGFIGSAEMLNINPKPTKFITKKLASDKNLYVKKGTVLLSCSGTIGNVTFVNKSLEKFAFSQHIIRLICKDYSGYIYAFLNTQEAQAQIQSLVYGAVIPEIEPEHLQNIIIPSAPEALKKEIHELVIASYDLRDQSNELLDCAEKILYEELQLKPIEELKVEYFDNSVDLRNFTTNLEDLNLRLDCSYHLPIFNNILNHVSQYCSEIQYLKNPHITKSIILPGRFKRTYVDAEHGIKFIGGKQINDLNPNSEKFLSKSIHNTRLGKELFLHENCILITRSGTIGKVSIVPKHWENWAANEHIIRVFPKNKDIAGYLFCWLNSDYGKELICKHTYGAVVDEIDTNHVGDIPLPLLKNQ